MNLRVGIPSIGMRAAQTIYQQYEAAAIQAARNNGAALWYVGNDPIGFVFEDSAGTIPAAGTDPIGYLKDRVGTNNATQATAGNRPTLELQANGYYGMRFDGTNDLLSVATLIMTNVGESATISSGTATDIAFDRFFISSRSASVANPVIGAMAITATTGLARGTNRNDAGITVSQSSGISLLNTPVVATVTASAVDGLQKSFVNGVLYDSDPRNSGTTTVTNLSIGASITTTSVSFAGLICLVCASPVGLSDSDRIAIERFAALLSGASYP